MSSLFKKRRNLNIKPRRADDDDDENTENRHDSVKPCKPNPQIFGPTEIYFGKKDKKKPKERVEKKTNVLSFEDELEADDGIVFQEKKSKQSYKLRKELKKERKEKKKEEKEKLKYSGEKDEAKEKSGMSVTELDDLGIKIVNGREAESIAHIPGDSDESDENGPPVFRQRNLESNVWKAALQSGKIPDANLIHRIRKERQKARERDFIPIDDTIRVEDNKSRLIRDDDNDHSEDEGNRMTFSVNLDEADRKQRKEVFEAAQDDAEDQEVEWEMQQLKNAGATVELNEPKPNNGLHSVAPSYATNLATMAPESVLAESLSLHVGLSQPVNYQAEGIIKRLKDSLESVREVHHRHRLEADNIIDDLITSKSAIARCNADSEPQMETFQFYQDMRGYVTDLRECLDHKLDEVKKLEEQIYLSYRRQSQKLTQRRRQDVKDHYNECSPFAANQTKIDEYRVRRSAEREGRRTRRRRERERKNDTKHHDGMSTDDEEESQSDKNRMENEISKIEAERLKVFEDVEDEFSVVMNVMRRFENWRNVDFPSYNDAYVLFNLPKIFSTYIRLDLALWNPLDKKEKKMEEVESMLWFRTLSCYGTASSFEELKNDPDKKLMSNVVEKVILPKIKELVNCYWDPLSHVQSVRLVNLIRHYTTLYPTIGGNSKQLKELTQTIVDKIRDCITNDVFMPTFPASVYDSRTSAVSLFFQRQFWSSWKLLGSVLMWHRILNDAIIHDLAIRSVLNLYLIPSLRVATDVNIKDALDKTRNVINVLPREWSKQSEGTHVFLDRLCGFLVSVASKLDPTGNMSEYIEVLNLLKTIGAKQQAKQLQDKYL